MAFNALSSGTQFHEYHGISQIVEADIIRIVEVDILKQCISHM